MKKSLVFMAIAVAPTMVLADATSNMTWSGTVPTSEITAEDFVIKNVGSTAFDAGMLGFQNDGEAITISTASRMQFNVVASSDEETPVASYQYSLDNVQMQKSGGFMEETSDIIITGNGEDLVVGGKVSGANSGVNISIKTGQDVSSLGLAEGDDVIIQATILVADADVTVTATP
ncbi:hypothetical protein L1D52_04155 [Vibrio brasiliensis]|uniref:hypothetical protein n=1 Tax=Vibrio brasiliensis TaxID=170652 RepID=UPI001EFC9FF5|nr:hypothetical protein [Vibrio brasiliensis]MCG9781534.1 hypothetical protein [Vibrio brasiliensis]